MTHRPNILKLRVKFSDHLTDWFTKIDPEMDGVYIRDYGHCFGEYFAKFKDGFWYDSATTPAEAAKN